MVGIIYPPVGIELTDLAKSGEGAIAAPPVPTALESDGVGRNLGKARRTADILPQRRKEVGQSLPPRLLSRHPIFSHIKSNPTKRNKTDCQSK